MKFTSSVLLPIALAGFCAALPSYERRTTVPHPANTTNITIVPADEPAESTGTPTQTQVLQYALTLEHLESAFYNKYLSEFTVDDFANQSYPDYVYPGLVQISEHEQIHVEYLTEALGSDAVEACNYTFPVTDIASFVQVSKALEAVGASAYLGAAHFLSDPEVLTVAGSIYGTEARHSGFILSDILNQWPWSSSFETPLDMNQAYTLASAFITSCPSSNAALPLEAFPALSVNFTDSPGFNDTAGAEATFQFNATANGTAYVAFLNGLNATFVPFTITSSTDKSTTGTAIVPDFFQGIVYGLITSDNISLSDSTTIAGPVIFDFFYPTNSSNY